MGLDLGTKTIGVAISDDRRLVASALDVVLRKKFSIDAAILGSLIIEYKVSGIILGLPLNMNGTEGPRCQSTRQFAVNLDEKTKIPIAFWDERLSTQAVEKHLISHDVSRRRRKKVVDKLAAQFILQGALDFLQNEQS
ncbi:MAG: Holliday junction resolvase RuvX [Pseudomonadota bacterium]|nr:Holliday junction resolvase RuvX [Pseudomonadota bacterium]